MNKSLLDAKTIFRNAEAPYNMLRLSQEVTWVPKSQQSGADSIRKLAEKSATSVAGGLS